jgi:hypothetical protein
MAGIADQRKRARDQASCKFNDKKEGRDDQRKL